MDPQLGGNSNSNMVTPTPLSRLEELTNQLNDNNGRLSDLKGMAYDIAVSLGGSWPVDPESSMKKDGEAIEVTKMERLYQGVSRFSAQLNDLESSLNQLKSLT